MHFSKKREIMKAHYQVHKYRNIVLSRQSDCGWYTFSRRLDTLLEEKLHGKNHLKHQSMIFIVVTNDNQDWLVGPLMMMMIFP